MDILQRLHCDAQGREALVLVAELLNTLQELLDDDGRDDVANILSILLRLEGNASKKVLACEDGAAAVALQSVGATCIDCSINSDGQEVAQ